MKPALNPDESFGWRDMVLMWKYGQRSQGAIQVGDIVMVRSPLEPEKILVKRVVGVGGDEIITKPSYPKRIVKCHLIISGSKVITLVSLLIVILLDLFHWVYC